MSDAAQNTGASGRPSLLADPDDVIRLHPQELVRRVRGIIRARWSTAPAWVHERHEENVPAALLILRAGWLATGKPRPFAEEVVLRLCDGLRALDRAQQPELYDSDKRYHPENEPASLDALTSRGPDEPPALQPVTASALPEEELLAAEPPSLVEALRAAQIHPASQAAVLGAMQQLEATSGESSGPVSCYRVSGMFGRTSAATQIALPAVEVLDAEAERAGTDFPAERFNFYVPPDQLSGDLPKP